MPVYEYLCKNCDMEFEELMRGDESLLAHCPKCGASDVQRLLSIFAAANGVSAKNSAQPSDFSSTSGHACGCGSCSCGAH